ncbi:MAG: sulfotransferase [Actinomycetota bacterium]|nr:sulfotransferase [Actinomycetota bacterium]
MTEGTSGGGAIYAGPVDSPKIVFILGSQRGGTTIFGRLLGEIEGFVFAGAVRRLWLTGPERRCSCGEPNQSCDLWSKVMTEALGDGITIADVSQWQDRHLSNRHSWVGAVRMAVAARRGRGLEGDMAAYAGVAQRLYQEVARQTGARVVVDTSKHPNDAMLLRQLPELSVFFVHIVRDPRGSAYSVQRRDVARRARRSSRVSTVTRALLPAWRAGHATLNWLTRHGASEALRRMVPPDRSLLVRYEDLAERPCEVLRQVAAFVGEAPGHFPDFSGDVVDLQVAHSPSCSKRLPAASVPFRLDERWITGLSSVEAVVTRALAWPLMHRYGYGLRRPRRQSKHPGAPDRPSVPTAG